MKHLKVYENYIPYPSLLEVEEADYNQICDWYGNLEKPTTEDETKIYGLIFRKFRKGNIVAPKSLGLNMRYDKFIYT